MYFKSFQIINLWLTIQNLRKDAKDSSEEKGCRTSCMDTPWHGYDGYGCIYMTFVTVKTFCEVCVPGEEWNTGEAA